MTSVLPAETLLNPATWLGERLSRRRAWPVRWGTGAAISVFYLGGLTLGYLFLV